MKEIKDLLLSGDCLESLPNIPDDSVDMVLCDLPYGTTQNKWDSIIPLDKLWKQYNRICKTTAAMVFTTASLSHLCCCIVIFWILNMSG